MSSHGDVISPGSCKLFENVSTCNKIQDIQLWVSCSGLKEKGSKEWLDAIVILKTYDPLLKQFAEHSRTEPLYNTPSPVFSTPLYVPFQLGATQRLQFILYLTTHAMALEDLEASQRLKFIASFECSLDDIICSPTGSLTRTFTELQTTGLKDGSTFTVSSVNLSQLQTNRLGHLRLQLHATELPTVSCLEGNKDKTMEMGSYIEIFKHSTDNLQSLDKVYHSEVSWSANGVAQWEELLLMLSSWEKDDEVYRIACTSVNYFQNKTLFYGTVDVDFKTLRQGSKSFRCVDQREFGVTENQRRNPVIISLRKTLISPWACLDYFKTMPQLSFAFLVDFSQSVFDTINQENNNFYNEIISNFDTVTTKYSANKLIPFFGFGGKLPKEYCCANLEKSRISHGKNAQCVSVNSVQEAYQKAFSVVKPKEPTYLGPSLQYMVDFVSKTDSSYYVLIILTDGVIDDGYEVIEVLAKASVKCPLSVVFVSPSNSYGRTKFFQLVNGSSLRTAPRASNLIAKRDIVTCISPAVENIDNVAAVALQNIPRQVAEYQIRKGVDPSLSNKK